MPARLHFSNSLDALADRVRRNLADERDPLHAPAIATPGPELRDWLKIRLAETTRVIANIAFPQLERLLWERLAERDRQREAEGRLPARMLDAFGFQGLVLAQLRRHPPEEVREYLASEEAEDAARRLCQLAGRLASLFREYEYNRVAENGFEGVAESWMRGMPCFEPRLLRGASAPRARASLEEVRSLERWQMNLYHAIFRKEDGLRDLWGRATGTYRYTLPQYAELALADPGIPPAAARASADHLFGLANVSPFHRDLIGRLADPDRTAGAPAHFEIYALNPCAEFWEDALTLKERRARGARPLAPAPVPRERVARTQLTPEEIAEGGALAPEGENGLLALFGKPGRESIRLWCALTEYDFHEDFREPDGDTLLSVVRRSVLRRQGPLETGIPPDDSLRFRKAEDPRCEIEVAGEEIARMLREDPGLRPEDCAILCADLDPVLPAIRSVFAGHGDVPGNVPVLLPDGAGEESPLLRGFRCLLALGSGNPDRRDFLALLDIPAVLRKTGLESFRLGAAASFLEAAGLQEGWGDAGDEAGGGSTVRDAETRILLAFAMDAGDAGAEPAAGLPRPASEAVARMEREEAAALLDWLAALRRTTRPLRDGRTRSFPEWADVLRVLREIFLDPGDADLRADSDLRRFLDELAHWGHEETGAATADAILIRMLFEDRFRGAGGPGRSAFLRGGVRVGSLSALRGLPFRHVWITGLSTSFPTPGEAAPLDLRGYGRLPGETEPAARDLYALLETLVAARERVTLSWPARGSDGKELQPSRALTGLMAWLESDVLPAGAPLAFHEVARPPAAPPAALEPGPPSWLEEPREGAVFRFRDVASFLQNPARLAAQLLGGMDWGVLDAEEEERAAALFLDSRDAGGLRDAALRNELLEAGSGAATFDRLWRERARGGLVPPPPFGDLERDRLREEVAARVAAQAEELRAFLDGARLRFAGSLRLGPQGPAKAEPPVINLPALDAAPLGVELRLGGILPWFFASRGSSDPPGWALLVDEGGEFPAYLLQLFSAALDPSFAGRAPEIRAAFGGCARLIVRKGGSLHPYLLPAFEPDAASAILRVLLSDFARAAGSERRLDDLPLDRIETLFREAGNDPETVGDWSRAIEGARRTEDESTHAHVPRGEQLLRAMSPRVPDDAGEAIRRRVLPYLEWKAGWEKMTKEECGEGNAK